MAKGFRYEYQLTSQYPQEYEAVNSAYTQAGWEEIGAKPDTGIPTHIIYEWNQERPPIYPFVNWP